MRDKFYIEADYITCENCRYHTPEKIECKAGHRYFGNRMLLTKPLACIDFRVKFIVWAKRLFKKINKRRKGR